MQTIISQIKHKFKTGTIVEQLIFINIAFFILTYFVGNIIDLAGGPKNVFLDWLSLPADFNTFLSRPWSIVTYGFMHGGFIHLLFNLLYLYYMGNLFSDYFIPKKLLHFYLMGTITGGIIFMLAYNNFPKLQEQNATLVGASSGVMAILIGLTTYIPNYELKFRFIGFVKLWVIALFFIAMDLINLADNTGGHLAHLGGALYGFLAIYYRNNNVNGKNVFSIFKRKSPLKTTYRSNKKKSTHQTPSDTQQKINEILDKISKSGYDSLSKDEKEFLFQQGKK